jgi:hypothetical protein
MAKIIISLYFIFSSTFGVAEAQLQQKDFLHALKNLEASPRAIENAKDYNFLFISGFLNEFLPAYFYENVSYLLSLGVSIDNIHIYYPPSNGSLFANADLLASHLKQLKKYNSKKWILISHSKGGFESLLFATKYKELFLDSVHKLHIVQAAFGTPISDYASGEGRAIDGDLGLLASWNCQLGLGLRYLLDSKINKGIYALTESQTTRTLNHMFVTYGENIEKVKSKIFYTISRSKAKDSSYTLFCPSRYLETYYGDSDGLIPVENQYVPGTGKIWADLKVDHTDTMLSFPISNTFSEYRFALMKLIVEDL